ncbi:hypothetical protein A0H81_05513 [Grifola frondosa]|uniref:Enoyl reductase (ER) domain-containing protein n=1 Tax=Grifola frondosa TaxID=5627 RepID=A0A1C7MEY3_GRIFR|nr:hypothetical protein A0H81_05513 [Grifola frondosa]
MAIPNTAREYRLPKSDVSHWETLTIQNVPVVSPSASEVLVKVHAVSLQYRDLLIAKGLYTLGLKEDLVPCSDMAGEVVAIGDAVKGFKIGDRVCANFFLDLVYGDADEHAKRTALGGAVDGVLIEYRVFPAHDDSPLQSLVHIPEYLTYEEASTLPCAGLTAYNALMGPVPLKGGDVVLVQGTGGVSMFGLQFAVACGATVIATSSSDRKLKVAQKLGAKHVINYKTTPDWDEEVLKLTNGLGADHIIEVGGPGTLPQSVNCVRYGKWIHDIGFVAGAGDVSCLPHELLKKNAILRGIAVGSRTQFEDMNRLLIATGLHPVIDKVFTFEQALEAYDYLDSQQHVGKVVIKVSKD